jgi:hypothetical protein
MPRVWHLEAIPAAQRPLVVAACGLRWTPTAGDELERTDDINKIRYEVRCATCNSVFARRLPEPEGA